MLHDNRSQSINLIKRKMENEDLVDDKNTNQKIPNISNSPSTNSMMHKYYAKEDTSLTIEDLEELKYQLLGILHNPSWTYAKNSLEMILSYFASMNYDLNFTYQSFIRPVHVNLAHPWYSSLQLKEMSQKSSNQEIIISDLVTTQKNESKSLNNSQSINVVKISYVLPLSPLHYAAYLGVESLIIPLLQAGASKMLLSLNYPSYEFANKTPAEIALQRGYHRVFHIIEEYDPMEHFIPQRIDDMQIKPLSSTLAISTIESSTIESDTKSNEDLNHEKSVSLKPIPKTTLNRVSSNEIFLNQLGDANNSIQDLFSIGMSNAIQGIMSVALPLGNLTGNDSLPVSNENSFPAIASMTSSETRSESSSTNLVNDSITPHPKKYQRPRHGIGSHAGYKNPTEDRVVVDEINETTTLYLVLDGHGGSHYAEQASLLLPKRIKNRITTILDTPSAQDIEKILIEEIVSLDRELVRLGDEWFLYTKGGTTCVCAIVTETDIIVANVGDSPAIVFSSNGLLLRQTDDHNPDNNSEYTRIKDLGASIVVSNEFGDLRVQSGRGQLTVTRALGQYEFKKGQGSDMRHVNDQIVTCYPQTYIWSLESIINQPSIDGQKQSTVKESNCYLALYSDSFTEALRDHRSGRLVSATGRPEQVIGNFLTNIETLEFILYELKRYDMDVTRAAQDIADKQVHKFHMYNSFFGDNTSIILVDLGIKTFASKECAIAHTATSSAPLESLNHSIINPIDVKLIHNGMISDVNDTLIDRLKEEDNESYDNTWTPMTDPIEIKNQSSDSNDSRLQYSNEYGTDPDLIF